MKSTIRITDSSSGKDIILENATVICSAVVVGRDNDIEYKIKVKGLEYIDPKESFIKRIIRQQMLKYLKLK